MLINIIEKMVKKALNPIIEPIKKMIDDFVMGLTDRVVSIFGMEFFTEDEDQEMRGDFTDKLSRIGELVIYVLTHPIFYLLFTIGFILVAIEAIIIAVTVGTSKIAMDTFSKVVTTMIKAALISGAMGMITFAFNSDEVDTPDPLMKIFGNYFKIGRFSLGVSKIIRNSGKIYKIIKSLLSKQEKILDVIGEIAGFVLTIIGVSVIICSTITSWKPPVLLILFLWTTGFFMAFYGLWKSVKSKGDNVLTSLYTMEMISIIAMLVIAGSFITLIPRIMEEGVL